MDLNIQAISPLELYRVRVYTIGQMVELLMDNGQIIKLMALEHLCGQTVKNTLVNWLTISAMCKELSFGLMVENMMEIGIMVSSTEMGYILYKTANQEVGIGNTGKELNGQIDRYLKYMKICLIIFYLKLNYFIASKY